MAKEIDWQRAKLKLAKIIIQNLKAEFDKVHLSGNLANTITIKQYQNINGDSGFDIEIPAQIYDVVLYRKKGVVVYTGKGSYANAVDVTGGYSGLHTNYVDNCIRKSISQWLTLMGLKAKY